MLEDIREIQKTIIAQAATAWPEEKNENEKVVMHSMLTKLLEEAGELAGACRNYYGSKSRPDKPGTDSIEEIEGEVGDVLVVALRICSLYKIDAATVLNKTMEKFQSRLDSLKVGK